MNIFWDIRKNFKTLNINFETVRFYKTNPHAHSFLLVNIWFFLTTNTQHIFEAHKHKWNQIEIFEKKIFFCSKFICLIEKNFVYFFVKNDFHSKPNEFDWWRSLNEND